MTRTDLMDMAAIAQRIGVAPTTVRIYHTRGRKNRAAGIVKRGDLPEPEGLFGRSPVWRKATVEAWIAQRPGRGVGSDARADKRRTRQASG